MGLGLSCCSSLSLKALQSAGYVCALFKQLQSPIPEGPTGLCWVRSCIHKHSFVYLCISFESIWIKGAV